MIGLGAQELLLLGVCFVAALVAVVAGVVVLAVRRDAKSGGRGHDDE